MFDITTESNKKMNIGMGGKVLKSHKQWMGKWYKPWTWFSKKHVVEVIDDFRFIECSIVSNPVDPICKIEFNHLPTESNEK